MNKYLLLRDNKQSGPYTTEELKNKGIKPYDLVWLEGKSAAWRYPSEIEELKPFSPIVEEQPFDRFYKKPLAAESTPVSESKEFVNEVRKSEPVQINMADAVKPVEVFSNGIPKKIFVTLPAGQKQIERVEEEIQMPVQSTPAIQSKTINEHLVPPAASISKVTQPEPAEKSNWKIDEPTDAASTFTPDNYYERKQMAALPKSGKSTRSTKMLLTGLAAACLILVGVVVALVMMNSNQRSHLKQLDQLVSQIQEKQEAVPESNYTTLRETSQDMSQRADTIKLVPNLSKETSVRKPALNTSQIKSEITEEKKSVTDAGDEPQQEPPVIHTDNKIEPESRSKEATVELAKKNLFKLISISTNNYKTGVLGGISDLQLVLSNKSLHAIEQVEVEVRFLNPEKRVVKTQSVIFENVAPGEQIPMDIPKSNRGVKVEYSIKKVKTREFGMAYAGM